MSQTTRNLILAATAIVVAWAAPALAFHDAGVAHCNGCHTMHNSYEGALVDADSPNGNPWLLVDATPSDTCLGCHSSASSSRGVLDGDCATGHSREKGGGNYIFLSCVDLAETTRTHTVIPGERAGHNLDAPGNSIVVDGTLSAAPGGTFPSSVMGCTSCHDPHGTDSYRILYGAREVQGFYPFTNPPPVAAKTSGPEAPDKHAAYASGMSEWCGNCHMDFAEIGSTHKHKVGENLGAGIAMAYNLYAGSDNLTGGLPTTAYWPEVPFEDPDTGTYTTSSTQGPTASSQVMCLTCHRAHATSAASAGRWDFNVTFNEEDGTLGTYPLAQRINGLSLNANRSLCNKCHVQDIDDEIVLDADVFVDPSTR
jgi:hypothetical protein